MLQLATSNKLLETIDAKVERMKQLQVKLKVLQTEYDGLKQDLLGSYFQDHSSYTTKSGLIIATYKSSEREVFNQVRFKFDYEQLFFQYRETQTVFQFLLR